MLSLESLADLLQRQRRYFETGETRSVTFRRTMLQNFKAAVARHEGRLLEALSKDLGKSHYEGFVSEIGFIYADLDLAIAKLGQWSKKRRVWTPLVMQPGRSYVKPEPKGQVLIIGAWNYPVQLLLGPLVGVLAAGNCAVLKPSELAPHTAAALDQLISETFPPEYCVLIQGGPEESARLLTHRFDHILFTGSHRVGKMILKAAAEHLTPVTLELGGKSPCLIDREVDLEVAARRITWGKFFNAGQTCVAPDYVLVPQGLKSQFLAAVKRTLVDLYGVDPRQCPDYGRIIDHRHFDRVCGLMKGGRVVLGGDHDRVTKYIGPTVLDNVELDAPLMQEEIFGPLMPVIGYDSLEQAIQLIEARPQPLALYVYTKNRQTEARVLETIPFGGGSVNVPLMHLLNPRLPFGGIGRSGMGAYHGPAGFQLFSHHKSIYKTPFWLDLPLKYPPYGQRLWLAKKLM